MSPIDTYHCSKCGYVTDEFRSGNTPICPRCDTVLTKKFPLCRINVPTVANRVRDVEEEKIHLQNEKDEKEWAQECAEIEKGDEKWHHEFAHVENVRTPERKKYLESEGDARLALERKGKTGIK